ncbi:MAG: ubiquinone biosynthesis protein COQ4 [Alphaproteobacteria bacterium]|nr:ubiquinone biosynthesis protein COQ4 [Alphaproteobacteria bacterium]MDX5415176.1 ubiquinone biosynthesis protein COQ4 [Alphaproteobacteria bacterium]MDX5492374.1 ubiquinone biosynthesis protein COQ4 [Alphaproteobacteria bacterium]
MTTASPTEFGGAATAKRKRKRIQPLKAIRAIRALIADKEDTSQVFKIIDALSGNSGDEQFQRFVRSETGRRILSEKRNLVTTLSDQARLAALPQGTLGRAYYEFMAEENLTADGLVEASEVVRREDDGRSAEERLFGYRNRDQHDLWHVVTGYGRDGLGELALLAFTYAQTRNRGIGFIVLVGANKTRNSLPGVNVWRIVREAWRNGRKSAWLPATDWEAMLERPLAEVRAELGIVAPAAYKDAEPHSIAAENAFKAMRAEQQKQAA